MRTSSECVYPAPRCAELRLVDAPLIHVSVSPCTSVPTTHTYLLEWFARARVASFSDVRVSRTRIAIAIAFPQLLTRHPLCVFATSSHSTVSRLRISVVAVIFRFRKVNEFSLSFDQSVRNLFSLLRFVYLQFSNRSFHNFLSVFMLKDFEYGG